MKGNWFKKQNREFENSIKLTRMLSETQARLAAVWKISPTNRWLSLHQFKIWVKYHSGLSSRLVCLLPMKWYSNLCLNGFTSNSIGVLMGGKIIECVNLTYINRSYPGSCTWNRYSANVWSLLSESFVGLNDSITCPRFGHFMFFRINSKSLQKERN